MGYPELPKVIEPNDAVSMAESITPSVDEGKKSKYLSFRVANFTVTESCKLAGVHLASVLRWRREDDKFAKLDGEGMTQLRKQLSNEYLDIEFTRNFRLVMQKDFDVLYKSANNQPLTEWENNYLLKLRTHYTPQSLAMIKQLLSTGSASQPFDFTRMVMTIKREKEQLDIKVE